MVVESELQAFYASKQQQSHSGMQTMHIDSTHQQQQQPSSWCPCVAARQSITRTSAFLCTCNPGQPRPVTVSPTVSTSASQSMNAGAYHAVAQQQQFQYQRSHKFGGGQFGSPAVSPLSWDGQQNQQQQQTQGATSVSCVNQSDTNMMEMDTDMNASSVSGVTEATESIMSDHSSGVNDSSAFLPKRTFDEGGGVIQFAQAPPPPAKRLRQHGVPSAATILCSRASHVMSPEQRDELGRLLQQNEGRGPVTYGHVVQHFAARGMWLDSDAKIFLLRVLGEN